MAATDWIRYDEGSSSARSAETPRGTACRPGSELTCPPPKAETSSSMHCNVHNEPQILKFNYILYSKQLYAIHI